ncbi:MAG: metallophosphoesterase [Alphaproteobacteria bacterium]|nr:metallophosphoesterase [Alphaproteobacteria bacterium]
MFLSILIVCFIAALYTAYRLIGQGTYSLKQKLLILLGSLFLFSIPFLLKRISDCSGAIYSFIYVSAYFLFILGALFFCLIIVRDVIWFFLCVREMAKNILPRKYQWKNPLFLKRTNYILMVLAFALSVLSLYSGLKTPVVKETILSSNKIEEPLHIVVLGDMHLKRTTSLAKVKKIVEKVNALNPDIVLFPGDTVDDDIFFIEPMLKELKNIRAFKGMYSVSGNHEFYVGDDQVKTAFMMTGIHYLADEGVSVKKNVYLAGIIDDKGRGKVKVQQGIEKSLMGAKNTDYKILLSHRPATMKYAKNKGVDLLVAAHTHGGQIFPFHMVSKVINGYLSGLYHEGKTFLYVTRGAGQWGPQMRLFAPSEISLIKVHPVQNLAAVATDEKQPVEQEDKKAEKEVVYPISQEKNNDNFVKNTMNEKENVSDELVTQHLENAKEIADKEAALQKNEEGEQKDVAFEEAKESLDAVFNNVILENTKKELAAQKQENKKLEIEIKQLRVDFEKTKDSMDKVIVRQKAAIKLLEAERKVLKDELVEQKLLLKSERKATQEILATQKKLLAREREIAKKAFKLQSELLAELKTVKKELAELKSKEAVSQKTKKVLVDASDFNQTRPTLQEPKKHSVLTPLYAPKPVERPYAEEQRREEKFANMEVIYHEDGSVTRQMTKTVIIEYPTYFSTVKSVANYRTTPIEEQTADPVMIENALRKALKLPLI